MVDTRHVNIEFSTMYFEIEGYEGEIDEDGIIEFEVPCPCGASATMCMSAENFVDVAYAAKKFRDRRIAFKAKVRKEPE